MNTLRRFATAAASSTPPSSRLARRGKAPVSLDHFIQRQRTLALWRSIVRCTADIKDPSTATEMRAFARAEFVRHREVRDLGHIRYLVSEGKTQFDAMKSSLFNAGLLG